MVSSTKPEHDVVRVVTQRCYSELCEALRCSSRCRIIVAMPIYMTVVFSFFEVIMILISDL